MALQVGDDVVFGSRTTIMCSDASAAAAVTLAAGAMVADRCVLLPGVTVGRRCVLGLSLVGCISLAFGEKMGADDDMGCQMG